MNPVLRERLPLLVALAALLLLPTAMRLAGLERRPPRRS